MNDGDSKDQKDKSGEETANPELLFCDDAQVVDYLNALLASGPALSMDFKEIHFVHSPKKNEWKSAVAPDSDSGNTIMIESDYLEMQVQELREENQNLKFKTELATIDTQVLRGENNNLKSKIESMMAQLHHMETMLHATTIQNEQLQTVVEKNIQEINGLTQQLQSTRTVPPPEPKIVEAVQIDFVPEILDTFEHITTEPDQQQEAERPEPEQIDSDIPEIVHTVSPVIEDVISEQLIASDKPAIQHQDRSMLIQAPPAATEEYRKKKVGPSIFSHNRTIGGPSGINIKSASKIVKTYHMEKRDENRPVVLPLSNPPASAEPVERNSYEVTYHKVTEPQISVVAPEIIEETASTSQAPVPRVDSTDEITVDPGQTPKVLIRRNIKNYVDLQNESESPQPPETGHTIVL